MIPSSLSLAVALSTRCPCLAAQSVVYLTDMNKKAEMDTVWCNWIPADGWPNRACVGTTLAPGDLARIRHERF